MIAALIPRQQSDGDSDKQIGINDNKTENEK